MKNREELVDRMAIRMQEVDWDSGETIVAVGESRQLILTHALKDLAEDIKCQNVNIAIKSLS